MDKGLQSLPFPALPLPSTRHPIPILTNHNGSRARCSLKIQDSSPVTWSARRLFLYAIIIRLAFYYYYFSFCPLPLSGFPSCGSEKKKVCLPCLALHWSTTHFLKQVRIVFCQGLARGLTGCIPAAVVIIGNLGSGR